MASVQNMTPDTREKEKIIGGIFNLSQFLWIAIGFVLFLVFVLITFKYLKLFAIILGLPFVAAGFFFAIKKVEDLPLPKYLRLKHKYKKTIKYYINAGFHSDLEFDVSDVKGE